MCINKYLKRGNVLKKFKIYMDNCCFNRPFDNQMQIRINIETEAKLFIQELITNNEIDFVWSFILLYENENNPFDLRKEAIFDFSKYAKQVIGVNNDILILANEIRLSGIKEKDSLHIASAIISNCDLFITTDDRILKYESKRIKIIDPIDFIKIWEGNEK